MSFDAASQSRTLALGFVLYHPSTATLERLRLVLAAGYEVYLFDNTPDQPGARALTQQFDRFHYATAGRNVGLGYSIASITAQAYYGGHTALLFFDQDTRFDLATLAFVEEFRARHSGVEGTHAAIVFDANRSHASDSRPSFDFEDVVVAISSGSLFFLDALRRAGWHNPSFFVDCVDYELCLSARQRGLRIARCASAPGMDHVTEQADSTYHIGGRERRLRRYPLSRVLDTIGASARLLMRSLTTAQWAFAYTMFRSLVGYIMWQLVARMGSPSGNEQ